jgi:ABC-2 type transport system ATP-binding protein
LSYGVAHGETLAMSIIEVKNLTRRFGALTAVDDLSFSVGQGDIVGFLGPNGAGKSTTMRMLTGSLGATSGSVTIAGYDIGSDARAVQRIVGYLPETPPLYTDMTVRSYLRFCAKIKKAKSPNQAADHVIDRVDLGLVAGRLIGNLSKGFRQRVGVAQALVHEPRLLILDEPTSGLDPNQRVEIRALIGELAKGDVTVVLSTHILPEVEAVCGRVIILHRGKIVAQDTLAGLSGAGQAVRVVVARPSDAVGSALLALPGALQVKVLEDGAYRVQANDDIREAVAACAVNFGLLELGRDQAGLEDVFLKLTRSEGGI